MIAITELESLHNKWLGVIIWVILLARYNIVWLGFRSVVIFVVYCIYFIISKLPLARPGFDGETLSQGQGWWESFTKNEVVVFRLYLYQMDLVLTDLTDQHPSESPL